MSPGPQLRRSVAHQGVTPPWRRLSVPGGDPSGASSDRVGFLVWFLARSLHSELPCTDPSGGQAVRAPRGPSVLFDALEGGRDHVSDGVARSWAATLQGFWSWQMEAACRSVDTTLFYSPEGERGPRKTRRELAAKQV